MKNNVINMRSTLVQIMFLPCYAPVRGMLEHIGQSVCSSVRLSVRRCKTCLIDNWRTIEATVLKLGEEVGHYQQITCIKVWVINSNITMTFNAKTCPINNNKTQDYNGLKRSTLILAM